MAILARNGAVWGLQWFGGLPLPPGFGPARLPPLRLRMGPLPTVPRWPVWAPYALGRAVARLPLPPLALAGPLAIYGAVPGPWPVAPVANRAPGPLPVPWPLAPWPRAGCGWPWPDRAPGRAQNRAIGPPFC